MGFGLCCRACSWHHFRKDLHLTTFWPALIWFWSPIGIYAKKNGLTWTQSNWHMLQHGPSTRPFISYLFTKKKLSYIPSYFSQGCLQIEHLFVLLPKWFVLLCGLALQGDQYPKQESPSWLNKYLVTCIYVVAGTASVLERTTNWLL